MPRRTDVEDDWDDDEDWEDESGEDDPDGDEDEDEPTVPCPYCRRELPEDVTRCPYSENYISREDAPQARKPWWIIIGIVLALYATYRWVAG